MVYGSLRSQMVTNMKFIFEVYFYGGNSDWKKKVERSEIEIDCLVEWEVRIKIKVELIFLLS